jgi:Autotransporter beta-domain
MNVLTCKNTRTGNLTLIPLRLVSRIILGLASVAILFLASPTQSWAQLGPGCTCPAGYVPSVGNTCMFFHSVVPATCPVRTYSVPQSIAQIGQIAASQQQLSFWGVQQILQGRRDQLQGTLGGGRATSSVSGYAAPDFDQTFGALGYSSQAQGSNPLASPVYKAPPAPAPTMSTGPSWAAWTQGLGDWEHRDAIGSTEMGRFTHTVAAQAGVDATWKGLAAADDAFVFGFVGSFMDTHVSTDGTTTKTRMTGSGVGIYGTAVKGGFSADMTTKFDFLELTSDFGSPPTAGAINLTNAGVSGNIQYKQDLTTTAFVEPTGGFSFTRAMFGSGAAGDGLTDASTVRLQAGARWGGTWTVNGISIEPSLKTLVYSNVIADGSSATTAVAASISPTDVGKVRGEADPSVNFDLGDGYSASLSGLVRFGNGLQGGSANINIRKQW